MAIINGTASGDSPLNGTEQDDSFFGGGTGNSIFDADFLNGLGGNDTFFLEGTHYSVRGGDGFDRINFENYDTFINLTLNDSVFRSVTSGLSISTGSIEAVTIGDGGSDITGTDEDNSFVGGDGNDSFIGNGGNDIYNFGSGTNVGIGSDDGEDTFLVGLGTDTAFGGTSSDTSIDTINFVLANESWNVDLRITGPQYAGSGASVTVAQIDNIVGSVLDDTLHGNDDDNTLIGSGGDNILYGHGGNDSLNGGGGSTVFGGSGDDTLRGSDGFDANVLDGGEGDDTAIYQSSFGPVTVDLNLAAAQAGANGDTLVDIENLVGSSDNDVLIGNGSDNRFEGGLGSDTLNGGAGWDTAVYSNNTGPVSIDLSAINVVVGGDGDTLVSIENLVGSSGNDLLAGNLEDNRLEGGAGNDTLFGGEGDDMLLPGTGGEDSVSGGDGNDTISFEDYSSDDGVGGSSLTIQLGGEDLQGAAFSADYIVDFDDDIENVTGSVYNDGMVGNNDANILMGGGGNDGLNGLLGDDTLAGGLGDDTYYVRFSDETSENPDSDTILEEADEGTDVVIIQEGSGSYTLAENVERLEFIYADGDVQQVDATGNALNNFIEMGANLGSAFGLAGDDTIVGSGVLSGGSGNDSLDASDAAFYTYFADFGVGPDGGLSFDVLLDQAGTQSNTDADTMVGGAEGNLFVIDSINDVVIENTSETSFDVVISVLDSGTLEGLENVESLYVAGDVSLAKTVIGNDRANILLAIGTGNTITALGGDDVIIGSTFGIDGSYAGTNDTMDGGEGTDTVRYATSDAEGMMLDLTNNANNTGEAEGDVWINIENISGSDGNDTIKGNAEDNKLDGGISGIDLFIWSEGDDTILGGDTTDTLTFVDAASGVRFFGGDRRAEIGTDVQTIVNIENITGSIYGDYMEGTEDDNRFRGLGDYDWFVGSDGNDYYDGGNGRDMISYAAAQAGVTVSLADSGLNAGQADGDRYVSIERVTGSVHVDIFYGDDGANDFRGLGGYDVFYSSTGGRERYDGGNGSDTVTYVNATSGIIADLSRGFGSGGDARLDLYTSIENLGGTAFDDILTGTDDRNNLRGLSGDDMIFGRGGIDRIFGGRGDDTIDGGAGSDYILYKGDSTDFEITRIGTTRDAIVSWQGPGAGDGTDTLRNIEYLVFDDTTIDIWSL